MQGSGVRANLNCSGIKHCIDRSGVTSSCTTFESCSETNREKKETMRSLQLFTQKNFDV